MNAYPFDDFLRDGFVGSDGTLPTRSACTAPPAEPDGRSVAGKSVTPFYREARHVRIEPPLPLWHIAVMALFAAFIGAMLATGGVL